MQNNERFDFRELDTDSRASVLLRRLPNGIQLSISIEKNGDIDLVLSAQEYRKLLSALNVEIRIVCGRRPALLASVTSNGLPMVTPLLSATNDLVSVLTQTDFGSSILMKTE